MNFKFELKKSYFVVVEKIDNSSFSKTVDFEGLLQLFNELNGMSDITRIIIFPDEISVD